MPLSRFLLGRILPVSVSVWGLRPGRMRQPSTTRNQGWAVWALGPARRECCPQSMHARSLRLHPPYVLFTSIYPCPCNSEVPEVVLPRGASSIAVPSPPAHHTRTSGACPRMCAFVRKSPYAPAGHLKARWRSTVRYSRHDSACRTNLHGSGPAALARAAASLIPHLIIPITLHELLTQSVSLHKLACLPVHPPRSSYTNLGALAQVTPRANLRATVQQPTGMPAIPCAECKR